MDYKAHIFQSMGKGKLHPQRMQCGRHLFRNGKGTHVVKYAEFKRQYNEEPNTVCNKCLEWAIKNGIITD